MGKFKFSRRVDFTYFIGAGVSLILFIVSVFYYRDSGLPMILSTVSFLSYAGVLIRGIIDPASWGTTSEKRKISAFVGFTFVFVIFAIVAVLMLTRNFDLSKIAIRNSIIYGVCGIVLLYLLLYAAWFRKMSYK